MQKFCPVCEELLKPTSNPEIGQCSGCGMACYYRSAKTEPRITSLKMPYISIDIETTGLDPDVCQILEIGAVYDNWKTPINQLQCFRRVLVYTTVTGSPYAMALNADLLKQIDNPPQTCEFCTPAAVAQQFAEWIEANGLNPLDVPAAGKNFAGFDRPFLYKLPDFKLFVKFRHRVLDPAVLYLRPEDTWLPDSKTCYERAGMNPTVAHTAVEDALDVVWLIRKGIKRLKDMS